jgi:hypothetical protein
MSKHETPMTRWYWHQVGGTLIEEFRVVEPSETCGARWIDGVIVRDGEFGIAPQPEVTIVGKDVIIVQTKAKRLNLHLMGQTFFSAQLIQKFQPRSVLSVALCNADDQVLRSTFEHYSGMQVVIYPRT